jgi:chemotaxis protein methyltransferase CheR
MRAETLGKVRELIRKTTGIIINEENVMDLSIVVQSRLNSLRMAEEDYLSHAASSHDEIVLVASNFTVQETSFYRYREHYDRLKFQVLPDLIRKKQRAGDKRLLILSAGCATGEEPYTIAMLVHDLLKDSEGWDVRIVGTDINAEALRLAREGVYSAYRLRNIDEWYVYRYFDKTTAGGRADIYRLKGFIKSMVEFRQCNLIREPFELVDLAGADIIFCENVIIYFCLESIQRLIDNFHELLAEEGFLFLGHSETLNIVKHRFHLSWWNESFAYQKISLPPRTDDILRPRLSAPSVFRPAPAAPLPESFRTPSPDLKYLILQQFEAEAYDQAGEVLREMERSGVVLDDGFHLIKAEYLYECGEFMGAADECRKAAGLDPQSAEAHVLLGAIYLDLDMLDNARFEIKTALYLDPASILGYYYLGRYYGRCGDETERDYCLTYARHLLAERGNVLAGKAFPHYRTRRSAIYGEIRQAGRPRGKE